MVKVNRISSYLQNNKKAYISVKLNDINILIVIQLPVYYEQKVAKIYPYASTIFKHYPVIIKFSKYFED